MSDGSSAIPDDISESNAALVKRGATEGPLAGMIPLFVDVETMVDENTSLSSMTLLQYLRKTHLTAMGLCIGYEDPATIYYTEKSPGPPGSSLVTPELIEALSTLSQRDDVVFVAHNAAFDMRVLHYLLGIPYPKNWWCSMEASMGAWPELPDGFSLANLSRRLALPKDQRKLELDLRALGSVEKKAPIAVGKISNELVVDQIKRILKVGKIPWDGQVVTKEICAHVLGIYNARDVECMREVYVRQIARLPALEQGVGLRTNWQRRHHFLVDQERLEDFVDQLDANAAYAEKELESLMGTEDLRAIFNRDNDAGQLTSVRYARLKKIVNDKLANENFDTTSMKKIITKGRGAMLARNPNVTAVLTQTTRAGKMISHKRRASVFAGEERALVELGTWRAHTGRFSSPSTGKGLNLHNCLSCKGLVLTQRGWVNILALGDGDRLWDGEDFVEFDSVTYEGEAETVDFMGLELTPDHPVWAGDVQAPVAMLSTTDIGRAALHGLQETFRGLMALWGHVWCHVWVNEALTRFCAAASPAFWGFTEQPRPTLGLLRYLIDRCAVPDAFEAGDLAVGLIMAETRVVSTALHGPPVAATGLSPRVAASLGDAAITPFSVYDIRGVGPRARYIANVFVISNCPKHDKAVAEPIRKMYRMPPELCLVRGDLANVEYRVEGYLTKCPTVIKMFDPLQGGDLFTDPYSASWKVMTGQVINKKDPVRQVAKSATLGLGFAMGMAGYAKVLLGTLADSKSGISEELLTKIIQDNNWQMPRGDYLRKVQNELGCSQTVALSAYQIHRLFNEAHPEFRELANWLVGVVTDIASCEPGPAGRDRAKRFIDHAYLSERAPDRNLLNVVVDDDPLPKYPSIRIACGNWVPTVCWREPHMRKLDFDDPNKPQRLTIRKSALGFKAFSPQLAVENATQAAARNALCMGVERLEKKGFKDVIHIHDEVMLIVPRQREAVLAAKKALLEVFGPGHSMPYGWSILIKPSEVTITESLYEDENDVAETIYDKINKIEVPGPDRWGKILRNEPGCLENLP